MVSDLGSRAQDFGSVRVIRGLFGTRTPQIRMIEGLSQTYRDKGDLGTPKKDYIGVV